MGWEPLGVEHNHTSHQGPGPLPPLYLWSTWPSPPANKVGQTTCIQTGLSRELVGRFEESHAHSLRLNSHTFKTENSCPGLLGLGDNAWKSPETLS